MKQLSAQKRGIGLRVAIQGEFGSNSHMATVEMLGNQTEIELVAHGVGPGAREGGCR